MFEVGEGDKSLQLQQFLQFVPVTSSREMELIWADFNNLSWIDYLLFEMVIILKFLIKSD
jgi:hypothetical protein